MVLDHVTDEGNFGAIVRSAEVVGAAGVVIANARAAQVGVGAYKTSAGAVLHVPIARVSNVSRALEELKAEFDKLTAQEATFIFVTNEIGSGGVSNNALQRRFTDLQGWMNQYVAAKADEVYLMVSGIAVKIK